MAFKIRGNADVTRSTNTVRVNEDLIQVTTSATESINEGKSIEIPSSVTTTITRTLPAANTSGTNLKAGYMYHYINNSAAGVNVNVSGGTLLDTIPAGRSARVTLLDTSSVNGRWKFAIIDNPTGSVTADVRIFNATSDWGTAVSGVYTITITAANHGKGVDPLVQVEEIIGSNFEIVGISPLINAAGDVSIMAEETPDDRFAMRTVIL